MKKKKNGFIAISILYSFFLCFIALMMGLLASYANSALILRKINAPIVYDNKNFEEYLVDLILKETPKTNPAESGLFTDSDDEGTSYYFRGLVNNNYVEFANLTWRVVRINGDRTIRLVLEQSLESSLFNPQPGGVNNVGYTYNNPVECTETNECTSKYDPIDKKFKNYVNNRAESSMTNSDIKEYLENDWYKSTIIDKKLDDHVAEGIYCNDTTSEDVSEGLHYGTYLRIVDVKAPSLMCPDTDKNYGGVYRLKVGLLSADEIMLAGYQYKKTSSSYLSNGSGYWSMSPYYYNSSNGFVQIFLAMGSSLLDSSNPGASQATHGRARPVINLKEDVLVLKGDGTKDNPYVIDTD